MLAIDINFDLGTILAFITGIISGGILMVLLYLLFITLSIKRQGKIEPPFDGESKEDEVRAISKKYKEKFKELTLRQSDIDFKLFKDLNYDEMNEIARLYYPDSKNPLAELTINQIKELDQQLIDQVDKILSKFGLKLLGNVKLSKLISLINVKKQVDESEAFQKAKEATKYGKIFWTCLNFINPVMWMKKLVVAPAISSITKTICLHIIDIVAIKTNNIYSGEQFVKELTDEENQQFIDSMNDIMIDGMNPDEYLEFINNQKQKVEEKPSILNKFKGFFKKKNDVIDVEVNEPLLIDTNENKEKKKTRKD